MELTEKLYKQMVDDWKTLEVNALVGTLTIDQRLQLEQVRALKTIKSRLDLFAGILVISIVLAFLGVLF